MTKLYKYDSKGKIREWLIESSPDGSSYRTVAGLIDGDKVTSKYKQCKPKNVGKSNETSAQQQCELEIQSQINKKLDRFYVDSIEKLESTKNAFKPMLANKYKGWKKDWSYVISQPKLDGYRAIVYPNQIRSRDNKPIKTCDHILNQIISTGIHQIYPDLILDGEFYNHSFKNDFQTLGSYIKKLQPETIQHVQFHVFDCYDPNQPNLTYLERMKILDQLFLNNPIPNIKKCSHIACFNEKELDVLKEVYIEHGYEGQMVRLDKSYDLKRSNNLLKRKDFEDKEFKIKAILEGTGNWQGCAKMVECENDVPSPSGLIETFSASLKGTQADNKKILENAKLYIDGLATIRYFGRTDANKPRIGVVHQLTMKNEDRM